jgi:hypothetical protein
MDSPTAASKGAEYAHAKLSPFAWWWHAQIVFFEEEI